MANNLWSNYTEKTATPVDTDEVMVRDSTDGKNKRLLFGAFWKWVTKKLNEATISELETDNKTIIGAINALNGNSNFAKLQINSDLNNTIAMRFYHTTQSNVVNSLKNKPSSIQSGEMIIVWLPSSQDNLYGCQFLFHTESTNQNAYMRHKIINQWTAWQKFALA